VQTLLPKLLPDGIFPTILWQKAYSSFWYGTICHYRDLYKLDSLTFPARIGFLSFPQINIEPDDYDYYMKKNREFMVILFVDIASIFVSDKAKAGIDYIIEETYDTDNNIFVQERDSLFEKLAMEDKNFATRFASCANAKDFVITFDDKRRAVPLRYFSFLSKMFYDTIVVDKNAAICYLLVYGCSLKREVKGISRALVDRIAATLDAHPQVERIVDPSAAQPQEDTPAAPSTFSIVVPRSLWEGKIPKSVRDSMQQQGFPDPRVIAYALYNWCGLTNKTQLGKLLGPDGKNDSTYLRLANKFLDGAATLHITTA
jgi:hypothetical protein